MIDVASWPSYKGSQSPGFPFRFCRLEICLLKRDIGLPVPTLTSVTSPVQQLVVAPDSAPFSALIPMASPLDSSAANILIGRLERERRIDPGRSFRSL